MLVADVVETIGHAYEATHGLPVCERQTVVGRQVGLLQLVALGEGHGGHPILCGVAHLVGFGVLLLTELVGVGLLVVQRDVDGVDEPLPLDAVARGQPVLPGVIRAGLFLVNAVSKLRSVLVVEGVHAVECLAPVGIAKLGAELVVDILAPIGTVATEGAYGILQSGHLVVGDVGV